MAETLELQIKTSADDASRSIGNLESKLTSLGSTLSSISKTNLSSFTSGLSGLSASIRELSGIDSRKFSTVATNLNKLGQLDTARLVSSSSALGSLSKQLSSFSGLSAQSQDITTLVASISKLGSKSVTNASTNIEQLGVALKNMMTTLSKAPTVSSNVIQMTNAIANLASQGSKVGTASRSLLTGFSGVTKSVTSTGNKFKGLSSALGKFYANWFLVIRAIRKVGDFVNLSSALTEVQNVVDTTFGDMTSKVDDFVDVSIKKFGMSELTAKQIASRFQAMGTAVGISSSQVASGTTVINNALEKQKDTLYSTTSSMADMSLNLTKLAADMASFYDVDQEDVAKSLESVFTGTTAPLRRYGLDITQATLKEWALKQGIDADVQSMSQAEKVLLRYQYVMANTTAAQGDFAKTADTWANSVRTLKQEIEAWGTIIGNVIINAFKPLVVTLKKAMVYVIQFTQTVADALGAIFGWTIEISGAGSAVDGLEDIADSTDGIGSSADSATASAKKLKKTLLSIDEIHALDDNSSSSSGSGSGSGSGGTGTSGSGLSTTTKQVDGLVEKYKSSIKDLYSLGEYIGTTITDSLNSINWDSVYQSASNFGTGLADFLNGLISPELFYSVGKTIAGALNTALHASFSFATTFDWENLGESIGEGINGFFQNYDWALAAENCNAWVQGLFTTLKETVKTIDWGEVFEAVKETLSHLDIETVEIIIGALVVKKIIKANIIGGGLSLIASKISESLGAALAAKLGVDLGEKSGIGAAILGGLSKAVSTVKTNIGLLFEGLFSGLSFGDSFTFAFGTMATTIVGVISTVSGAVLGLVNFVQMLRNGFSWLNEILMVVGIALSAFGAILLGLSAPIVAIVAVITAAVATAVVLVKDNWESIKETWSEVSGWFDEHVIQPVVGFFQGLWQTVSGFFTSLWSDIVAIWTTVSGWFNQYVIEPVVGFFQGLFTRVGQIFQGLWIIVQAIWIVVSGWFNTYVAQPIISVFQWLKTHVGNAFTTAKNTVISVWTTVSGWFNTYIGTPISNTFNTLKSGIQTAFTTAKNTVISVWTTVSGWFNTHIIQPVSSAFNTMASTIDSVFNGIWSGIKNGIKSAMNFVIGKLESGVNFIVDGLNSIFKGFNKLVSGAAKIVGTNWSGVELVPRVNIPRLATGGFPDGENGLFYANSSELVGKFSNGKTAVANNEQITEGIKRAVVEGMIQVAMSTSNQSDNSAPVIENVFKVDSETLYRMTQKGKAKHNQRYNVVTEF